VTAQFQPHNENPTVRGLRTEVIHCSRIRISAGVIIGVIRGRFANYRTDPDPEGAAKKNCP